MEESFIGNAVDPNYTVKYAFNTFEWKCKPFVYSGKGGNNNNFDSNAECESNCPLRGKTISLKHPQSPKVKSG